MSNDTLNIIALTQARARLNASIKAYRATDKQNPQRVKQAFGIMRDNQIAYNALKRQVKRARKTQL